jgi:hypothetical protein
MVLFRFLPRLSVSVVSPSLRPVYRQLVDHCTRLSELARRLHIGANSTCSSQAEILRQEVNDMEAHWKRAGVWVIPDTSGLDIVDATETHSAPMVPREIVPGQALLTGLVDSFHDHFDRLPGQFKTSD